MYAPYKRVLTDTTMEITGRKKTWTENWDCSKQHIIVKLSENIEILTSHSKRTDQRYKIRIRRTNRKISDFKIKLPSHWKNEHVKYIVSTYHDNRDRQSDPETISTLQNSEVYFGCERLQKTCRFQLYWPQLRKDDLLISWGPQLSGNDSWHERANILQVISHSISLKQQDTLCPVIFFIFHRQTN